MLIILFSQYLRHIACPFPVYNFKRAPDEKSWHVQQTNIFHLLPILLAILIMWSLCAILTVSDVLEPGSPARTDVRLRILYEAPWLRFPYPGQWGLPTVSVAAVFGMLAGVLASCIESIGDYYACARLAGNLDPIKSLMFNKKHLESLTM